MAAFTEAQARKLKPGTQVRLINYVSDNTFTVNKVYSVLYVDKDGWIIHFEDNGAIENGLKYIYYELAFPLSKSQKQHIINLINSI